MSWGGGMSPEALRAWAEQQRGPARTAAFEHDNLPRFLRGLSPREARYKTRVLREVGDFDLTPRCAIVDEDRVLERQAGRCLYCSISIADGTRGADGFFVVPNTTHLDHWVPLTFGGGNAVNNFAWACAECNLKKGSVKPIRGFVTPVLFHEGEFIIRRKFPIAGLDNAKDHYRWADDPEATAAFAKEWNRGVAP